MKRMKNIACVYFIEIVCVFDKVLLGTTDPATESSHYIAHYSNITFNEARSTCTDYGGILAEFPEDYNFSVLISSIGLPAYSQFWINASTYLNCTCLSTFKLHWIVEGINCNSKVYYICRQPFATNVSLIKTDKSLTLLQKPVQPISPSSTLHLPALESSLGFSSLQRPTEELSPGSKTLDTQILELSLKSTPIQTPVLEISLPPTPKQTPVAEFLPSSTSLHTVVEELLPSSTSLHTVVEELSPSSTSLHTVVEELLPSSTSLHTVVEELSLTSFLSPTFFSKFSSTSVSTVHIQEGHSRKVSAFNLASTLSPTFRPLSQSPEKDFTTCSKTANLYSTNISMIQFSCVQVCCSDVFNFCNNHTRENQRNISISELIEGLSIDKRSTSKQSRRLYSVFDSRTSAKAMGVGAMLIICSILTCIVAMDLPRIIAFFYNK